MAAAQLVLPVARSNGASAHRPTASTVLLGRPGARRVAGGAGGGGAGVGGADHDLGRAGCGDGGGGGVL